MGHHCDRCDSPASVHMTEITSGKTTERHLCEECARVLHVPQPSKELQKLLKSFEPIHSLAQRATAEPGKTCPDCGMTFAEFRQHGRFGCEKDYEVFGKDVIRLLERIHGASVYSGPMPGGGHVEQGVELDELTRVRARLQTAIDSEDYEEAAKLRDEIRRMQAAEDTEGDEASGGPGAG